MLGPMFGPLLRTALRMTRLCILDGGDPALARVCCLAAAMMQRAGTRTARCRRWQRVAVAREAHRLCVRGGQMAANACTSTQHSAAMPPLRTESVLTLLITDTRLLFAAPPPWHALEGALDTRRTLSFEFKLKQGSGSPLASFTCWLCAVQRFKQRPLLPEMSDAEEETSPYVFEGQVNLGTTARRRALMKNQVLPPGPHARCQRRPAARGVCCSVGRCQVGAQRDCRPAARALAGARAGDASVPGAAVRACASPACRTAALDRRPDLALLRRRQRARVRTRRRARRPPRSPNRRWDRARQRASPAKPPSAARARYWL